MKRLNHKGSALLWAIAIIMILEVTVAAALGISYSYYNRAVVNHEKRQVYLTAKQVLQNLVTKINANSTDYLNIISGIKDGDVIPLEISLPIDKNFGTIEDAFIKMETKKINDYDRDILTISVAADYDGYKKRINADMQKGNIEGAQTWQLLKYYEEEYRQLDTKNIRNAKYYLEIANKTLEAYRCKEALCATQVAVRKKSWFAMLEKDYPDNFEKYNKWYESTCTNCDNLWESNDNFRAFYFYGNLYVDGEPSKNGEPSFIEFDFDQAKNEDVKNDLLNRLKGTKLYIQPYFALNGYKDSQLCIIYANPTSKASPNNWNNVYLFYDADNGHWYYIKDKVKNGDIIVFDDTQEGKAKAEEIVCNGNGAMMTLFDHAPSDANHYSKEKDVDGLDINTPIKRWERFKSKFFKKEYIID